MTAALLCFGLLQLERVVGPQMSERTLLNVDKNRVDFVAIFRDFADGETLDFANLPQLRSVVFVNCTFGETLLENIHHSHSLRSVTCINTSISQLDCERIAQLRGIEELSISKADLAAKSIKALGELSTLKKLKLSHVDLSRTQVAEFRSLRKLIRLSLCYTGITKCDFIKTMDRLEELELIGLNATDSELADAINGLRHLRVLNLSATQSAKATAAIVGECAELVELYMAKTKLDDGDLSLSKLTKIREIDLADTAVGDRTIQSALTLNGVTSLSVDGTKISDRSIDLLSANVNLKVLSIRRTSISFDGLNRLRRVLPGTTIFADGTNKRGQVRFLNQIRIATASQGSLKYTQKPDLTPF